MGDLKKIFIVCKVLSGSCIQRDISLAPRGGIKFPNTDSNGALLSHMCSTGCQGDTRQPQTFSNCEILATALFLPRTEQLCACTCKRGARFGSSSAPRPTAPQKGAGHTVPLGRGCARVGSRVRSRNQFGRPTAPRLSWLAARDQAELA